MPLHHLLALIGGLLLCSAGSRAQNVDRSGIEYFISDAVHDTLAVHIVDQRAETPEKQFFLLWRTYEGFERGLSVIEAPGTACDAPRLEATARFIIIENERLPIISVDDNSFGVARWWPDPRDPSRERPVDCMSTHHWPYTVRFDARGILLDASYEGLVTE